jgi:hypothetical protein
MNGFVVGILYGTNMLLILLLFLLFLFLVILLMLFLVLFLVTIVDVFVIDIVIVFRFVLDLARAWPPLPPRSAKSGRDSSTGPSLDSGIRFKFLFRMILTFKTSITKKFYHTHQVQVSIFLSYSSGSNFYLGNKCNTAQVFAKISGGGRGSRLSGKIARGCPPILGYIALLLTSFSKICPGNAVLSLLTPLL